MTKHAFSYRSEDRFVPIPPWEQGLQTIAAEYCYQICTDKPKHVEGLCFDRRGELYVTSHYEHRILRLSLDTMQAVEVCSLPGQLPTSVKIHRDGNLYVSCVGQTEKGGIYLVKPDGTILKKVAHGYDVDDLAFDSEGGIYFTNLIGSACDLSGGVYYMTSNLAHIFPVTTAGLASPNGVALSTDESVLWVTEVSGGKLHRIMLRSGLSSIVYQFSGAIGPDSCEIDADDNLYVALYGQGRVMVFNRFGLPIGQVLLPNREVGHNLFATHSAVRPGTKELYMCASDDFGDEGSWIFRAGAFGPGYSGGFQFQ